MSYVRETVCVRTAPEMQREAQTTAKSGGCWRRVHRFSIAAGHADLRNAVHSADNVHD